MCRFWLTLHSMTPDHRGPRPFGRRPRGREGYGALNDPGPDRSVIDPGGSLSACDV